MHFDNRPPPSSKFPQTIPRAMGSGRFIDAIVQASTVELFHTYGVALAPTELTATRPEERKHGEWACAIRFNSVGFDGTLTFSVPARTLDAFLEHERAQVPHAIRDWLGELTNQLMGRIKKRLVRLRVSLHMGLPTPLTGPAFERHRLVKDGDLLYAFRSRGGNVLVSLSGHFDESTLVFSDIASFPDDGDVVLF